MGHRRRKQMAIFYGIKYFFFLILNFFSSTKLNIVCSFCSLSLQISQEYYDFEIFREKNAACTEFRESNNEILRGKRTFFADLQRISWRWSWWGRSPLFLLLLIIIIITGVYGRCSFYHNSALVEYRHCALAPARLYRRLLIFRLLPPLTSDKNKYNFDLLLY